MRMCVGCRQSAPKADLVRLVYIAGEGWSVELLHKGFGRGLYVHPRPGCWARLRRQQEKRAPLEWTVPDLSSMIEEQMKVDTKLCHTHGWIDGEGACVEDNRVTSRMARWNSWGESLGSSWAQPRGGDVTRRGGLKGLAGYTPILYWSRF